MILDGSYRLKRSSHTSERSLIHNRKKIDERYSNGWGLWNEALSTYKGTQNTYFQSMTSQ